MYSGAYNYVQCKYQNRISTRSTLSSIAKQSQLLINSSVKYSDSTVHQVLQYHHIRYANQI